MSDRWQDILSEPEQPIRGAGKAEDYEGAKPPLIERLSAEAQYVVNMKSGRVHRRIRIGKSKAYADLPQCNLDDIADRRDVAMREEVAALFWPNNPAPGRRTPQPCLRCFPPPDEPPEPDGEGEEGEGTDPAAEVVTLVEMDPEDRPQD